MSDLRVTNLKGRTPGSAPSLPDGAVVTGVVTATTLSGNVSGGSISGTTGTFTGNVSIAGTLTYDDVTRIDSVGIVTAGGGLYVGRTEGTGTGIGITATTKGHIIAAGVCTASSFVGDGSGLTGVASTDNIITGTASTFTNVVRVGTAITLGATSGIITATSYRGDGGSLTGISGGISEIDKVGIFLNDNNNSRYDMYFSNGSRSHPILFTPEMISARNTSECYSRMDAPVGSGISITAHIPLTSGQWNNGNCTIDLEWKQDYAGIVRFPSTGTWKVDWDINSKPGNNQAIFSWEYSNNLGTASTTWSVYYPNGWYNHNSNGTVAVNAGSYRNPSDYQKKAFDNENTAIFSISRIVSVANTSTYGMRYGFYRAATSVMLFGDTTWTYTKLSDSTF